MIRRSPVVDVSVSAPMRVALGVVEMVVKKKRVERGRRESAVVAVVVVLYAVR